MNKYRKGVFIVAYRLKEKNPEYLILKRKKHWKGQEFPKGGLKAREDEKNGVLRELKEEAGGCKIIGIKKFRVSGKYKYDHKMSDRPWIGQTYTLYSAEVKCNKIKIDKKEHSGFEWLNFEQAYSALTWPNQKKCLKIVEDKLKKQ